MNRSGRYSLFLLAVVLIACNLKATGQFFMSASEPDVRFMKLLGTARSGDISRQVEVADDYLIGHGVKRNSQLAAEWYEKAANAGDPGAQNQIGYLYQAGIGVPKDLQRAAHWYQLSAANGSISGKVNLALSYLWGIGVQPNPELGAALLKEASKKGSGLAAAYLGDLYLNGIGVTLDKDKAVACFERGTKLHSYYAEYALGLFLSEPNDHPRNLTRSVAVLRDAVSQGYVPAMYALGLIAVRHPESNVSHQEVLTLLKTASDDGSWKASAVLAVFARDGQWVSKSPENAYRHFKRAALQGGETVVRADLQLLSAQLNEHTIATLNEEATEWASNHPVEIELIHKSDRKASPFGDYALTTPAPGEHASEILPPIAN